MSSEQIGYPEAGGQVFTAGHSGSETSQERAVSETQDGTKRKREMEVLRILSYRRGMGVTVAELRGLAEMHHGQASSALSTMHKAGVLERLTERRSRCQVYVLPEYVGGRETAPHGRTRMVPVEDLWEAYRAGYLLGDEDPMTDEHLRVMFDRWLEDERG